MAEPDKKKEVRMRNWEGLISNADTHDIPPGATTEQVNVTNVTPGQLTVREGFRAATWDN